MIRNFFSILSVGLLPLLASVGPLPAATEGQPFPALASTQAGKRVDEYLKAFNTGDEAMRDFFTRNVAAESIKKMPVSQRVERYRQMHSVAESFALRKVLEVREDRVGVIVEAKAGMKMKMEFQFEPAPPHLLLMVKMQEAQGADEGITRMASDKALVAAVEGYLQKAAQADEFSGVVLVAYNGAVLFQKAYGEANKEKHYRNTLDTRFNLGSVNKNFTELAIHQLAAQGKLSFQDPIKKFLPDYPNKQAAEKVTIQHLLDMNSGIGDFFGERYDAIPKEKLNSGTDYLPLFADKPLEFEPGAQKRYSNGGYIVLGAIIEKVAGMDYYSYVRTNLFQPAGMLRSDSFAKTFSNSDIAVGYTRKTKNGQSAAGLIRNDWMLPQRGSSAGGGYSNARDLLKYTQALRQGPIAPTTFESRNGLAIAGGTEGVNAMVDWNPKTGYTVIVLANYDPPSAEKVAHQIRAWLPEMDSTKSPVARK